MRLLFPFLLGSVSLLLAVPAAFAQEDPEPPDIGDDPNNDEPGDEPDNDEPGDEPDNDEPGDEPDNDDERGPEIQKSVTDSPEEQSGQDEDDSSSDDRDSAEEQDDGSSEEPSAPQSPRPPIEPVQPAVPPLRKDQEQPSSGASRAPLLRTEQAAAAALMDRPPEGPSLSPLKFSTSTWSRLEIRENYDDLGVSRGRFVEGDRIVFRTRLGMQTHALPLSDESDVLLQFTPQASGQWGIEETVGAVNLGIYEGYFKIRTPRLDVQVGRMMLQYGDEVVIGSLDWHQAGRAFDGVRAHYKMDKGYLDVFGTQVSEGADLSGTRFLGGDEYFWGVYTGVGGYLGKKTELDLYFLGLSSVKRKDATLPDSSTFTVQGANLFTAGTRLSTRANVLDFRVEAGVQFGDTAPELPTTAPPRELQATSQLSYQADVELGLSLDTRTRIALGGVIASGDDPSTSKSEGWTELYPTGHKFLGLMDIIGSRTNVASANLKVRRVVFERLTAQLDAHVFARLKEGGLGSVGEPGLVGTEIDTQLIQMLGKYAMVRGLYGLFIPQTGKYANDRLAHYAELQAGVTF